MKKSRPVRIIKLPRTPGGNDQQIAITASGIRNVTPDGEIEGSTVGLDNMIRVRDAIVKAAPIAKQLEKVKKDWDSQREVFRVIQSKCDVERRKLAEVEMQHSQLRDQLCSLETGAQVGLPHAVNLLPHRVSVGCKKLTYENAIAMANKLINILKRQSRRSK